MKLEDQVCTKEQSIELVELGVDEYSIFRWKISKSTGRCCLIRTGERKILTLHTCYPAYTGMELDFLLGKFRVVKINVHEDPYYRLESLDFTIMEYFPIFGELTSAQANAKALIILIRNKSIDPKTLTL